MHLRAFVLLAISAALGSGCAMTSLDSGGDVPSDTPPVGADAWADAMAHAICDHAAECCATNALAFDEAECLASQRAAEQSRYDERIAAGASYDPVAAGRCVAATSADVEACSYAWDSDRALSLACKDTFPNSGGKKLGEPCSGLKDCDLGYDGVVQCAVGPGSTPICVVQTPGKAGDACSIGGKTTFSDCILDHDHFYCLGDGPGDTCTPLKSLGDACPGAGTCTAGVRCDATSGTCVEGLPAGSACTFYDCATSLHCDETTKTCVADLAAGEPCAFSSQCAGRRCDGGRCRTSRWATTTGVCR